MIMGDCNFCRWERMKKIRKDYHIASAKERMVLDSHKNKRFENTFGPGVTIVNEHGEFVAWFMELPDCCVC